MSQDFRVGQAGTVLSRTNKHSEDVTRMEINTAWDPSVDGGPVQAGAKTQLASDSVADP